eukprot:TRINITY_DN3921_c0_g1_i1.p1 TRINITY_DN3921_c0_g1~~TRINITY_DN3921_c0_g1_i1.p1  ORF type:complete len:284 (+),score=10.92 TRINITY_DN3921_c0_g1_i1:142-993(+)
MNNQIVVGLLVLIIGSKASKFSLENRDTQIRKLQGIIGEDTRATDLDTSIFPFNTIGLLTIERGFRATCTATAIGPRTIITTAHCVYDIRACIADPDQCESTQYTDITFETGFAQDEEIIYQYKAFNITAPPQFMQAIQSGDMSAYIQYDIAILTLESDLAGISQFLTIDCQKCDSQYSPQEQSLSCVGFPLDFYLQYNKQTMSVSQCTASYDACDMQSTFMHECDTTTGMAGAPLFSIDDNGAVLKGIHARYERDVDQNVGIVVGGTLAEFIVQALGSNLQN